MAKAAHATRKAGPPRAGTATPREAAPGRKPASRATAAPGACACGGGCPRCATAASSWPENVLRPMESDFGTDFSDIRLHRDSRRAAALGALAFTQGREVHVAPGRWAPHSAAGRELIAHELAHVQQQRQGRVAGMPGQINAEPALEREADAQARRVVQARPLGRSAPGAIRTPVTGPVQRVPDPEGCAAPAGIACQTLGTEPATISRSFTYPQNSATLTRAWRTAIDALAATWHAQGASGVVRVDGYASAEGPCDFNWTLSCQRAQAVVAELTNPIDGSPGVPAERIDAFAHGESNAASATLPGNRRATVSLPGPDPGLSQVHGADQRADAAGNVTTVPDADLAREIGYELDPSSRPAPVAPPVVPPGSPPGTPPVIPPPPPRVPWDGVPQNATPVEIARAAAARQAMTAELFTAYDAYLTFFRPTVVAQLARPRVPFTTPSVAAGAAANTGVVDIANQAQSVLESRYGVSMDASASTAAQGYNRAARHAAPTVDPNIFDPYSAADRQAATATPDLAPSVAWWLFENDVPGAAGAAGSRDFATTVLARHHYATQDPGAQQFRSDVALAYAAARTLPAPGNRRQLIDYRLAQWSERGQLGITLQSAFDPGPNANRAELFQRWNLFKTATHESLHLRAHPAFDAADKGRGALKEGFTEMFTIATLNTGLLAGVRAGTNEPLRRVVEGQVTTPTPDASLITDAVTPTQYAEHRAAAERIRDGGTPPGGTLHAGIGEPGVRAVYFQGHVEYLGLDAHGDPLGGLPAAGVAPTVHIPAGITGLNELALRTNVPRATIEADNPGIAPPLPATAVLAGCTEHIVVTSNTIFPRTHAAESVTETREQIATQHGVSVAALAQANPDIPLDPITREWPTLVTGQRILIPKP
ncbi:eCIS core domain-containing protein [Roseateles cellulosilyticus]|uniref:DUF4157 domain-containing protein n=1 Tax=Pelomonas cellulosilytica TaxID=2906762 RepID=A0ABS8XSY4_9BURK|nr:DUF4157 domain-containing protein [Pelomonas sp. P8]MCE4555812.1 DUF4157 domain-containing protein [Pelomonas sp. P8]